MDWNQTYELGIEEIDNQHKQLVEIVSQLHEKLANKYTIETLKASLRFVVDYTKFHFEAEEKYMKNCNYPELAPHQKLHTELINEVMVILKGLKETSNINPKELIEFLEKWVTNHIAEEDKKFGIFLEKTDQVTTPHQKQEKIVPPIDLIPSRIQKLKELFGKKLIMIEDFKHHKERIFLDFLKNTPPEELREAVQNLDPFLKADILTTKEKETYLKVFFSDPNFEDTLSRINSIEDRLFFIKMISEAGIIDEDDFEKRKNELLVKL
jgi:hemerythrin